MAIRGDLPWDPQMIAVLEQMDRSLSDSSAQGQDQGLTGMRSVFDDSLAFANEGGPEMAMVTRVSIPAGEGDVSGSIYRPVTCPQPSPVTIYLHGGGWCVGSTVTHDRLIRELAHASATTILSVDYALAPEKPFPAALDDCLAAAFWLCDHAESLGLASDKFGLAGDSAGANLALGMALCLRDTGDIAKVGGIFAAYPVCDFRLVTASMVAFAEGCSLTQGQMSYFWESYAPGRALRHHPYAAPLRADLHGLPPVLIQLAEFDVLHDEGQALADRMGLAGVNVTCETYGGMAHGFLNHPGQVEVAAQALKKAGNWLANVMLTYVPAPSVRNS
ncbi:alpha/beta hydrolase fold domain-containing protein [Okibacterium endophyticum]